jgi:hypothetical protein
MLVFRKFAHITAGVLPPTAIRIDETVPAGNRSAFGFLMSGRKAQHASLSRGWINQSQQHFHQGTFAGAIGSQQAKDLPLLDGEADLMASYILLVLFGQIAGFD